MSDFAALAATQPKTEDAPASGAAGDESKPETTPDKSEETAAVAGEAGGEEPAAEEESTAHFEPVVRLEEVEVKTMEEEEEVLWKRRAKLFIFGETLLDKGTGTKNWRERGTGEIKFLRHKEHQKIRVLMRQEKTMKVIANHVIDPRIKLVPNAGSEKSWVWVAFDFAQDSGELEETTFALRLGSVDDAKAFKEQFNSSIAAMEKLLAGADAEGAAEDAAANDAVAALESLSVEKKGEEGGDAAAADPEKEA